MDGLSPIERKKLKARAHALDPVVHIGGKGLTEAVIAEIGRAGLIRGGDARDIGRQVGQHHIRLETT